MAGQTWLLLRLQGRGELNTFRHTLGPADRAGGVIFAAVLVLAVILAGSIAGSFAAGAAGRYPAVDVPRLFPAAVLIVTRPALRRNRSTTLAPRLV
jgi:hypothetical protein